VITVTLLLGAITIAQVSTIRFPKPQLATVLLLNFCR